MCILGYNDFYGLEHGYITQLTEMLSVLKKGRS